MPSKTEPAQRTGRPPARGSQDLDDAILGAAERLFTVQGYAATSMAQIAAAAGSGKQTIYRRYPTKETLFEAVVQAISARLLEAISTASIVNDDPLYALRAACHATLDHICDPDVISVLRIMIAEAERFPKLAEVARRINKERYDSCYWPLLRAAQDRGQKAGVPVEALGHILSGLMVGWVSRYSLLGEPRLADRQERAAFFEVAWRCSCRERDVLRRCGREAADCRREGHLASLCLTTAQSAPQTRPYRPVL